MLSSETARRVLHGRFGFFVAVWLYRRTPPILSVLGPMFPVRPFAEFASASSIRLLSKILGVE